MFAAKSRVRRTWAVKDNPRATSLEQHCQPHFYFSTWHSQILYIILNESPSDLCTLACTSIAYFGAHTLQLLHMHAEINFLHRYSWLCSAGEAMIGAEGVWGCDFIMLKQRAGPGLNRMERARRRRISRWGSCQRVKIKDTSEAETNCFFDNTLLHSIMQHNRPSHMGPPHPRMCTCTYVSDAKRCNFRAGYSSMPFCMSVAGMFLQPYILVCIWGHDWGSHSGWFTRARSSGSNSLWRTWGCTDSMWREAEDCVKGRMKESIWKGHRKDEQAPNNGLRWCKTSVQALL